MNCGYDLRASPDRCPECGVARIASNLLESKMPRRMRLVRRAAIGLCIGLFVIGILEAFIPSRGRLGVSTSANQSANAPVVLNVFVTNDGVEGLSYQYPGSGPYPSADYFWASLRDSRGGEFVLPLSNSRGSGMRSGFNRDIAPGQTIAVPAAIPPLPPGKYTLFAIISVPELRFPSTRFPFLKWPAMRLEVIQIIEVHSGSPGDSQIEHDLLRQVREGDPFATYASTAFGGGVVYVIDAMIGDLDASNPEVVTRAAQVLWWLRQFPSDLGERIQTTVQRLLPLDPRPNDALLSLCSLAAREGSDASLDAYIACVRTARESIGFSSEHILQGLHDFKQPRAKEVLRGYLTDQDPSWSFRAAYLLSVHRDPDALAVLLGRMDGLTNDQKASAFYGLDYYWDDPRVLGVIQKYVADSDQRLRDDAIRLHAEIVRRLEKKPSATAPVVGG